AGPTGESRVHQSRCRSPPPSLYPLAAPSITRYCPSPSFLPPPGGANLHANLPVPPTRLRAAKRGDAAALPRDGGINDGRDGGWRKRGRGRRGLGKEGRTVSVRLALADLGGGEVMLLLLALTVLSPAPCSRSADLYWGRSKQSPLQAYRPSGMAASSHAKLVSLVALWVQPLDLHVAQGWGAVVAGGGTHEARSADLRWR
ncbi:unnamed protein product, partial [Urochloa humidicola]